MARNLIALARRCTGAVMLLAGALAGPALAQNTLPTNGRVVAGSATIGAPNGNTLSVNQSSNRAVVNWNSFSVGQPNTVNFAQPSASAAILNRVTGATPSTIAGQVNANGQVYIVNPNGIAITPSGSVQVGGGFVASTLGITNGDFMSGRLAFTGNGASAGVSNAGRIGVGEGGYAALIGGTAANSGVISVPLGKVALGSGEQATLDLNGDGFMQVAAPSGATTAKGQALVSNSGRIEAAGGSVQLQAATVASAIRNVVNMSGVIAANSVSGHDGAITLGGGPGGAVAVTGALEAAGSYASGGNGGRITVDGARVRVGHRAVINASGAKGGSVLVGVTGPGGQNEAQQTTIASGAQILARGDATIALSGGYIETSGVALKLGNATIDAGRGGTWLTDPSNLIIDATAATIIDNALAAGTNVIEQTTATGFSGVGNVSTGNGDISVVSPLSWGTAATLTLSAFNNITVSAPITVSGGGTLVLTYNNNQGGINTGGALTFVQGQGSAQFTTEASNPALFINNGTPGSGNGTGYTLVYTPTELANINTHTSGGNVVGNYAIAAGIDLGGAAHGAPVIGNDAINFNGTLDGLGNTISNVTINSGSFLVGFISTINGTIRDLALGVDVTSTNTTGNTSGGLAAFNQGTVSNVHVSGSVSFTSASAPGNPATGGLVGANQGSILLSSSTATVSSTGNGNATYVGGLVGVNEGSIDRSFAAGAVTSTATSIAAFAGGLAGSNDSGGSITNSYAMGNVSATHTGADVGGLVGQNGLTAADAATISAAFSTGTATGVGGDTLGGLIGARKTTTGVSNAYWDTSSSGILSQGVGSGSSTGIAGVTTATLGSALPNGFSSSVWGNVRNQITPYIPTNPGPVLIGNEEGTSPPSYTLVFTPTQLAAIGNAGNLAGHFALAQDVDLSTFGNFTPIGNNATLFTGVFNGLGNVVANLTINTSAAQAGLFGFSSGTITNVGVVGGSVTDTANNAVVGALLGDNGSGLVTNSYATAAVTGGTGATVGGLIGTSGGALANIYATGAVTGGANAFAGGLIGECVCAVSNAYATGPVTGGSGATVGGLVALNTGGASVVRAYAAGAVSGGAGAIVGGLIGNNAVLGFVTNGYWNADRSAPGTPNVGVGVNAGITALSGTQPFTATSYAGFIFTTTPGAGGNNWVLVDADGSINNNNNGNVKAGATLPMLAFEAQSTIQNAHQLQLIEMNPAGSYTLGRNIDATTTGSSTSNATGTDIWGPSGFVPLTGTTGSTQTGFTGTFSGLNATTGTYGTISNLTATGGLFGIIGTSGTVGNLVLSNVAINGGANIAAGGLAGVNNGAIFNVGVSGSISNGVSGFFGGLVGANSLGASISTSFAAVSIVNSTGEKAGFVASNAGTISDSYTTGSQLVDVNQGGTVTNAYALGPTVPFPGLIGNNNGGIITNGYYDAGTTGAPLGLQGDGSKGLTTAALQTDLPPLGFSATKWGIIKGKSYPYLCFLVGNCGETPQVVAGIDFTNAAGTTPAGKGVAVTGLVNGAALNSVETGGNVVNTGANGYYYYLLAPNTIPPNGNVLTYVAVAPAGAALADQVNGSVNNLAIYANTLHDVTPSTLLSTVNVHLGTAEGSNAAAGTVVNRTGNLWIDAASSFTIDNTIITGTLTLNAGGTIGETNSGRITAAALTGSSAGDTVLNNGPNNFVDSVAAFSTTTGGANGNFTLVLAGGNAFNIVGAVNTGSGTVSLTNPGNFLASGITEQTGGSITAGTLTGSAGGSAFFQQPGNQIVNLGPFTETIGANFALTDARPLTVSGALNAGSGFISLTTTGAGSNLVLNANLNAGNLVALNSAGTITQPSGSITAKTVTGSSVGGASMPDGNNVANFGPWSDTGAGSTGLKFTDGLTLTTAGAISSTGPITLATINEPDLILNTNINSGGTLTLIATGNISQTGGGITAVGLIAVTQLDAGGSITLNSATNAITGTVAINSLTTSNAPAGGAISFTDGSAFTLGAGAGLLPGIATTGAVTLTGGSTIGEAPGAMISAASLSGSSVGGAIFNQSNRVATFGSWSDTGTGSAGISLNDTQALVVSGAISSPGPVALATTTGNLTIGNASLTTISGSSFTATAGSGAQIILSSTTNGSTVATAGGGQTYNSPIVLGVITLLTDSASGPITFNSTIDGTTPGFGTEGLTANTTGTGVVTFKGAVGSTNPLLGLNVSGASVIDANVTTIGGQTYFGSVTLGNANATTIALVTGGATTNASVGFFGTLDGTTSGQQGLTVNTGAQGSVTFTGNVGGSVPLASLAATGSSIGIAGNVSTGGAQNYTGPVTLVGLASTFNSTANAANGAIGFTGAIDGSSPLTVTAGSGAVTFGGAVGGLQALTSLAATGGTIAVGGAVTTSGGVTLTTTTGNLTLGANVTTAGHTVTLNSAGTVNQTGGFITAATVTGSSVGGASMPDGNNVANFGPWSDTGAGSTGLKFTDGLTLTTAGTISSTGPITLSTINEPDLILATNINSGGLLTLFANGNINQTGGAITAPGLVATTQLDAGGAITLNSATNAIAGNVTLSSLNTAGTALAGGAISFTDGSALTIAKFAGLRSGIATTGAVTVVDSGNLTIALGATVTGGGVALATTGNFVNNEGADAVTASGGNRWLIYSNAPATDTFGNLNSGNTAIWGATFASLPPGSVTAGGNRYLFAQGQTLTVTTTNLAKTYGQDATAAVAAAFTESGFASGVANAFLADTAANVVTGTPTVTSTGAATTASVAGGPYPIIATSGSLTLASGYTLAFANTGVLTVNPAALTVTASNQSKIYGQTLSLGTTAFTTSGLVNTDSVSGVTLTSTGAAATATVAGSPYAIVPSSAVGSGLSNYTISYVSGALSVTPAALTVMASNQSKVYGQTLSLGTTAFTTTGTLFNGDSVSGVTLTSAGAAAATNVAGSPYAIAASNAVGSGLTNYTISYVNGALTVTPAALTASITGNPSKVYDGTTTAVLSSSNFTLTGFVAGQGATVSPLTGLYATANATAGIGVSANLVAGNFTANAGTLLSNYTLPTTAAGTGTITPKPLMLTANDLNKIYGNLLTFAGTEFSVNGLVANDTITSVSLASAGAAAAAGVGGNPYTITASAAVGTGVSNYAITYLSGNLTVTPRPVTVTADNLSRAFSQPNPPLTFAVTAGNLVNGDSLSGALATTANIGSAAGPYPITQGTLAATPNYSLAFVGGTLVVTPSGGTPVVTSTLDFGASPNKYIAPVPTVETSQSGLTPCSPVDLALVLDRAGSVVIFGAPRWVCSNL